MKNITIKLAGLALASAAFMAGHAYAKDLSEGFAGNPELMRELEAAKIKPVSKAIPIAMVRDGESSRDIVVDQPSIQAFTVVGRTASGKSVQMAPSDRVQKAVKGELAPHDRDIKPVADF